MPEFTADAWKKFRDRFQAANEHLAAEMAGAAEHIRTLISQLQDRFKGAAADDPDPTTAGSFERLFGELETHLFSEPIRTCEKLGPIRRTLYAMQQHQLELVDLARGLPSEITLSGAQLVEIIGPDASKGWRRSWLKWRKSPRPRKLREIVVAHVWKTLERRRAIDGAFELVLAQAELHLVAAWQAYRRNQLAALAYARQDKTGLAEERKWWNRTAVSLAARADHLAQTYRKWSDTSMAALGQAALRGSPVCSEHRQRKISETCQANLTHWHRQQRAVAAVRDLERGLSTVAREAAQGTRYALDSLRAEHNDVTSELDQAVNWLQTGIERNNNETFPPPKANLLSVEQRARDWSDRFAHRIRLRVPAFVEVVRPVRRFPAWRKPWRQLYPQRVLEHALNHDGLDAAREGFRDAESEHTAIVRDIEQARQVVTFALEAAREDGQTTHTLPREAAANALALLQHRKETAIDPQPAAEFALGRAEALTLLEAHTVLEAGRLGLIALVTRQGAPVAAVKLGQVSLEKIRAVSRGSWTAAEKILQWTAWKLGLERPVAARVEPVVAQPRLSTILEVRLTSRELPALYQRLFRLAPVEDQRFLVGREVEMTGLTQAFSLWQSGRSTSALVVGARGSGKTSLLNCASSVAFGGVPVVRGQFSERVLNTNQMYGFLLKLFDFSDGSDLVAALNKGRRVAVIEEFERTFLRQMNGFGALRDFLHLITATSSSTLWIISMNQASFSYLDAVLGLGRSFSHRINATAVAQEQMMEAILHRHTLSGLRLQFAPSAPGDPRIKRLRRFFGLELTPENTFFDALYRQSEGLFRSAFELWLGSIERIEGAVMHMLQPLDPNYGRLHEALKLDDLFTLQAILQHASLTTEEMAQVFNTSSEEARRRLERLQALEILEPEPSGPGLRMRSQAGRFVRDVLNQQNLL